jgi:hypothetical protein
MDYSWRETFHSEPDQGNLYKVNKYNKIDKMLNFIIGVTPSRNSPTLNVAESK